MLGGFLMGARRFFDTWWPWMMILKGSDFTGKEAGNACDV